MAVAAGVVVVQLDAEILAHGVQLVADPRQDPPAHLHGAEIGHALFPGDVIVVQAAAQHPQVEGGVVGHQHAPAHEPLDFGPELRESGRVLHALLADAGEPGVEGVKVRLRVHQGVKLLHDCPVLRHGDADGAHAVVQAVWRLHVKGDVSCHSVTSSDLR